eukprot:TRINITY_DN75174_c0_g1_i1.p2 TRINITY_DN75174_c0_g1~~TRINITY_DN75174_c0_g1_i1.p2  ORF type:complete len:114 (-),score=2.78 TRINITY_DN75174_c0_g1_i1:101-442(-)
MHCLTAGVLQVLLQQHNYSWYGEFSYQKNIILCYCCNGGCLIIVCQYKSSLETLQQSKQYNMHFELEYLVLQSMILKDIRSCCNCIEFVVVGVKQVISKGCSELVVQCEMQDV